MKIRMVLLILPFTLACQLSGRASDLPLSVQSVIDHFRGKIYFAAKNLKTGETVEFRADDKVQTASVIKLAIMAEVFAQAKEHRVAMEDVLSYTEENHAPGSGILQDLGLGLHLTVHDATVLMIALSDNSATNMLIDRVGVKAVNERMKQLGLTNTVLFKKVFRPATDPLSDEQKKWGLGVSTPRDMLLLLEKMYRKELVDAAASEQMIAILKKQRDRNQIPRFFVGEKWAKVEVANKSGALDRVRNDVGVVFTAQGDFVLSLFAQESEDQKWTPDNEATLALGKLAEALVSYFRAQSR